MGALPRPWEVVEGRKSRNPAIGVGAGSQAECELMSTTVGKVRSAVAQAYWEWPSMRTQNALVHEDAGKYFGGYSAALLLGSIGSVMIYMFVLRRPKWALVRLATTAFFRRARPCVPGSGVELQVSTDVESIVVRSQGENSVVGWLHVEGLPVVYEVGERMWAAVCGHYVLLFRLEARSAVAVRCLKPSFEIRNASMPTIVR